MIKPLPHYFGKRREEEYFEFVHNLEKCGVFSIQLDSDSIVSLWNVRIFGKFQGKHLGSQMIQECIEFITRYLPQVKEIYLFVDFSNDKAQNLYKKYGFCFTGEVKYSCCYEMSKILEK
jgi:ribosomal protein S18 acetylase RimI-like enzyme